MGLFKKDPLQIIAFLGYGTDTHFYARGRALEDESIDLESQSLWHLLLNTWKRFETDEIKNTNVDVSLPNGTVLKGKTDNHGYYKIEANLNNLKSLTNAEGWLSFKLAYGNPKPKHSIQNNNQFSGELLIPSINAEFGVVSDIDDTIIHTGVASKLKWRLIYNSFFKSAKRRLPLEGAADFYHRLHRGKSCKSCNPIFYVSHSPWNLYRYLDLFLRQNNFPKGPVLLRSMSTVFKGKSLGEKPQKQKEIVRLLKTYPDLPFILIGDCGEHDPDIYMEVAEKLPKRILAIYLRSVRHEKRMMRVKGLIKSYETTPVLLVQSSAEAINHARKHDLIV